MLRKALPLFDSPYYRAAIRNPRNYFLKEKFIAMRCLRTALAPLQKTLPLPLGKGKGTQGIGLINNYLSKSLSHSQEQ